MGESFAVSRSGVVMVVFPTNLSLMVFSGEWSNQNSTDLDFRRAHLEYASGGIMQKCTVSDAGVCRPEFLYGICAQLLSHVRLSVTPRTVALCPWDFFQARILEWVAISSSGGSSQPRDGTHVSCVSCIGRQVLY